MDKTYLENKNLSPMELQCYYNAISDISEQLSVSEYISKHFGVMVSSCYCNFEVKK